MYSLLFISRQSRWYHILHSSQHMAPPLLSSETSHPHLSSQSPQGNMPSPRAGPGWGWMSPLIINAIRREHLLTAIWFIHLCFSSPRSVNMVNADPGWKQTDVTDAGNGGGNRWSGPLESEIPVEKFESLTARSTTTKEKNMTIAGMWI